MVVITIKILFEVVVHIPEQLPPGSQMKFVDIIRELNFKMSCAELIQLSDLLNTAQFIQITRDDA